MKKSKFPKLLLMLVLVAGVCVLQPAVGNAQQDGSSAQQQPANNSSQPVNMNQASDSQTFSGKITKAGGKFVLHDTVSKSTYVLDDQDRARQFEGQDVKVSGTLDAQTKTIRVSSIVPST